MVQKNGQFYHPNSISVDSITGDVYVVDASNDSIKKFDSDGTLTKWRSNGTKNGQFDYPEGIFY